MEWLALIAFVTASTITPGPISIMIMASGVNFGFRRTLPHILGVAVGITTVITLAGFGVGAVLARTPWAQDGLLILSAVYLIYLAWRIASAHPAETSSRATNPLRFGQALAFQAVNPKVWALGMTAVAVFAPGSTVNGAFSVALTLALVGLVSNTIWGWFGTRLRRFLSTGRRLRIFNCLAGVMLVASLIPVLI